MFPNSVQVVLAQLFVLIPYFFFVVGPLAQLVGCRISRTLPSAREVALHVLVMAVINDFLFYWLHRAFHHPLLYGRFHKQHHEFKAPFGWASEFAGVVCAVRRKLLSEPPAPPVWRPPQKVCLPKIRLKFAAPSVDPLKNIF